MDVILADSAALGTSRTDRAVILEDYRNLVENPFFHGLGRVNGGFGLKAPLVF